MKNVNPKDKKNNTRKTYMSSAKYLCFSKQGVTNTLVLPIDKMLYIHHLLMSTKNPKPNALLFPLILIY